MARSYKIDGRDYVPEAFHPDEVAQAAVAVVAALYRAQKTLGTPGKFDTGFAVETLSVVIAAMLEMLPSLKTPRDLRVMTESVGDRIGDILRHQRAASKKSGEHVFHGLAALAGTPVGVPTGTTRQ